MDGTYHELGHWTGHPSRLSRDQSGRFGSPEYGREELCAEMTSAFVCAALGIEPGVRHADYLGSWHNRAIVRAASAASKAADFLLAFARTEEHAADLAQTLQQVRAMGAPRIELAGFSDLALDRLKAIGFISEIVSWKLRLFVPTGSDGPAILARLLERYPLERILPRRESARVA